MRLDRGRLQQILAVGTRQDKAEKSTIGELLYRVPGLLSGKNAPQSIVEFLAGFPAIQGLTRKELIQLAALMHERSYGDGEIIFDQGSPSAAMYLIREGSVELFRSADSTGGVVATLGPNEPFGEISLLLDEAPRQVSARSRGPSELLALTRPDFETLMERSPTAGIKILRALARVVALRFKMILELVEGKQEQ
jgi:CRP-like cAMP-binding protein